MNAQLNTPFRTLTSLVVWVLLLALPATVWGANESQSQRLTGTQITVNGSVTYVEDTKYPLMLSTSGVNWQNLFTNRGVKGTLDVGVIHEEGIAFESDYHYDFVFEVYKYDLYGNSTTSSVTLEVDHGNVNGVDNDRSRYQFTDAHKFGWKLTAVYDHGTTTSVTKPGNIYIEGDITTDRLYKFDHTDVPTVSAAVVTGNKHINFTWPYVAGAEEYDLEWGFVNRYNGSGGVTAAADIVLSEFDFEHNNTRITTSSQHYQIANTFEDGFLVYRIRARGWPGGAEQVLYSGKWSTNGTGTNPKEDVADWPDYLTISAPHEQTFNWQYQASYAEGGKRKEVMAYADGSSRVRQQVTRINTDSTVLVGETYYDYQGRAVVNVLPVPSGTTDLEYHPDFNQVDSTSGGTVALDRYHYDWDASGQPCDPTALELSENSGAADYYGTQTTPEDNHQDYIPDSEGYPYTQVEFMPDQTGRVRSQSMPGAEHTLGSDRESRMFYGKPTQEELDRLFGVNAGLAKHYQKNLVIDANGQVAVTYVDQFGRTVATSLAGDAPDNVQALSGQSTQQMGVDLLNKTNGTDVDDVDDDNELNSSGRFSFPVDDQLIADRELLVTKDNKHYDFSYSADADVYTDACVAENECHPYVYDIMIDMTDLCGESVLVDAQDNPVTVNETFGSTSNTNCTGTTYTYTDMEATLAVGQYRLNKTIQVNEQAVYDFADYYTDSVNNSCLITYGDFLEEARAELAGISCELTCDECLETIYEEYTGLDPTLASPVVSADISRDDWEGFFSSASGITEPQWLEEYYQCVASCRQTRPCEGAYQLMLIDVSPNGQWESELDDHWDDTGTDYKDDFGNDATVLITDDNGTFTPAVKGSITPTHLYGDTYEVNPEDLLNVADFKAAFQSSWAAALVDHHPEYCYYEACLKTEEAQGTYSISSFEYELQLRGYETYADANTALSFNSSSGDDMRDALIDEDPFFSLSAGTGYVYNVYDCGQSVPNDLTTMTFRPLMTYLFPESADLDMVSRYDNYMTVNGTTYSMFDVAYSAVMCGQNYGTGCTIAADLSTLTTAQKDEVWKMLAQLYLAEKQKLIEAHRDAVAILDNCYNLHLSLTDEELRFKNSVDIMNSLVPNLSDPANVYDESVEAMEAQLLAETGLCPVAFDFRTFLEALGTQGHLNDGASVGLSTIQEFSPRLYTDITGIASSSFPITAYVALNSSATTPGANTVLNLTISGGVHTCTTTLTIDDTNFDFMTGEDWTTLGSNWTIESIDQIGTITTNGSDHDFELLVIVDMNPGGAADIRELVIAGTTCLDLDGCEYDICTSPSIMAQDLTDIINLLATNAELDATGPVALDASPYLSTFDESTLQLMLNTDDVDYSASGNYGYIERATIATNLVGYQLEYSVTPSTLNDHVVEFVSVQYNGTNNYTVISLRAYPENLSGGYTYFTVTVTGMVDGSDVTPTPNLCCNLGEESELTGLKTLMSDVSDGNLVGNTTYNYNSDLTASVAQGIKASGATTDLNGSTFKLDFGTTGTWKVNDATLGLQDLLVFTKAGVAYDVASGTTFKDLHRNSSHSANEFTMVVVEPGGGGNEEIINVTSLIDIDDLHDKACDGGTCIPDPHPVLSCDFEWDEIEDYFTTYSMTLPVTESYSGGVTTTSNFRDEFCERQLKWTASTYLEYLTELNITSNGDVDFIELDDFANLNADGEMEVYIEYYKFLDTHGQSAVAISAQEFADADVAGCFPFYEDNANTSSPEDITDMCAEMPNYYADGCQPFPLGVALPEIEINDPCQEWLDSLAVANATAAYEQYLADVREDFMRSYIEGAINSLVENFDVDYNDEEFHQTLFYYDQGGHLVRTIPPQGVDKTFYNNITTSGNSTVEQARASGNYDRTNTGQLPTHGFATTYNYNSLGQLIKQHTPDGGTSQFWFDNLGRIVLSQNAKQANQSNYGSGLERYSYVMFDDLGRVIEAGEIDALTNDDSYANIDAIAKDETNFNRTGNDLFNWLTGTTDSNLDKYDVTHSFYDVIELEVPLQTDAQRGEVRNRITATTYSEQLDVTVSPFQQILAGTPVSYEYDRATHYSYDVHGNVSTMIQEFTSLERLGQPFFRIDYTYDLLSGNVHQVAVRDVLYNAPAGNSDAVPVNVSESANFANGTTLSGNPVFANVAGAETEYSRAPFYYKYEYDADNRLTAAYSSHDREVWQRDAKYHYYQHGPLARVEIGEHTVQASDYAYTIHGWLKAVNANKLSGTNDMGADGETGINSHAAADVMGFSLNYYTGDYAARTTGSNNFLSDISAMQTGTTYKQLYNGNISMMATALMNSSEAKMDLIANHYSYDQLQRIKEMTSFESGSNYADAYTNGSNLYGTTYSFDANGNLSELTRSAENAGAATNMDDFTYYYYEDDGTTVYNPTVSIPNNATNRLAYVTDASVNNSVWDTDLDGHAVGNYDYDDIGQLIQDNREKIETIEWTVGNKVSKVTRTSTSSDPDLEFKYDAGGNRVIKIVKPKDGTTLTEEEDWVFTYYVRDASGNVLTTYTKSATVETGGWLEEFKANEHHLYGGKRLGLTAPYNPTGHLSTTYAAWTNTGTSGTTNPDGSFDESLLVHDGALMPATNTVDEDILGYELGGGTYECSNHLGNVLATVSDKPIEEDDNTDNLLDGLMADVVSYSDYYPFGMAIPGRNGGDSHRYGFNGMEKDDELKGSGNSYDFGARIYDTRLAKFISVDPLERNFSFMSPYCFAANTPIQAIDENGEGPVIIIYSFTNRSKIRELIISGQYKEAMHKINYLLSTEPVDGKQEYSSYLYRVYYDLPVMIPGDGIAALQHRSAVEIDDEIERTQSTIVYGYVPTYDSNGKVINVTKTLLGVIPENYESIQEGRESQIKHMNDIYKDLSWKEKPFLEGDGSPLIPWSQGKKIMFGTVAVITAPVTIAAGGVWLVVGGISMANGIDDMGTDENGESLLQQLSDDPNYDEVVGNVKTGATFVTAIGGAYQLWRMGADAPTLLGTAGDAASLVDSASDDSGSSNEDSNEGTK